MSYDDKYPDMSAIYELQFREENKLKDKIKELETELEHTRKALDVAIGALFDIHKHSYACCNPASEIGYVHAVSYNALDKTGNGLEQINKKEEK